MQRRVFWEPGMRVKNTILQASDDAHFAWVDKAITLASTGRFGLIPNNKPFDLDLTVEKDCISIDRLTCFALTPGQNMIDIELAGPEKCEMPQSGATDTLLLIIKVTDKWKKSNDVFEEPVYEYDIIKPNSNLPSTAFPIARLVASKNGWKKDDDYVPPCLFVSSHIKYKELLKQFLKTLKEIEQKIQPLPNTEARRIMLALLPFIQQIRIDTEWGQDTLTPEEFGANIQKIAATFYTVSELLDSYNPDGPGDFRQYAQLSFNKSMELYPHIKNSVVDLCSKLKYRIEEGLKNMIEAPIELPNAIQPPTIAKEYRNLTCKSNQISIPVSDVPQGAIVFYSTDGSNPNKPLDESNCVIYDTSNDLKKKIPDRTIQVRLMALYDNKPSQIVSFEIKVHYEYESRNRYII